MIEGHVFRNVVDALTLVPLIASVYQVYLDKPTLGITKPQIEAIFERIKKSSANELPAGSHDVTPTGARLNYVINVEDQGDGDTIGHYQITSPTGDSFIQHKATDGNTVTHNDAKAQGILAKGNDMVLIAEAPPLHTVGLMFFGVLIYRPKGQPVFKK